MKFSSVASACLVLACASTVAQAHFELTYPATRGFDEDKEPTGPCGGFNTPSASRSEFPIQNGFMNINSGHVNYKATIQLVVNSNPSAADFTAAAASPVSSPPTISNNHPNNACLQVGDLSKVAGVADGVNATLQILYNGGDSPLYQCADVVLKTNPAGFDKTKCVNDNGSPTTSGGNTNPTNKPSAAASLSNIAMATLASASIGALALMNMLTA
ncbi:hypothetical protein BGW38_005381 [Lunasporangiospora selenospora]|uniref:Copper acquisition factor BIM1-like domain-containing protein n=1 Tax=Lunasporangiospora selenospora TaxID=979761 RepID=A0A9P6G0A7_9FUNG|nr:hypothetical protein BGW38_005381 [Lunasporangiospora selenospora]